MDSHVAVDGGAGFLIGFAVGYALKKLTKIILFITGTIVILLILFQSAKILSINDDALLHVASRIGNGIEWLMQSVAGYIRSISAPGAVGGITGFVLGIKKG